MTGQHARRWLRWSAAALLAAGCGAASGLYDDIPPPPSAQDAVSPPRDAGAHVDVGIPEVRAPDVHDSGAPDVALHVAPDGRLLIATAITAGGGHACAIVDGGTAWCWGNNFYGQLGNGQLGEANDHSPQSSPVAVEVVDLTGVTALSAGSGHTCALQSGGTVKCWGLNTNGQLGDGTANDSAVPVTVADIAGATAISLGDATSCAVLSSGAVECWGCNPIGRCGPGPSTPTPISGVTGATAITAGSFFACAIVSDRGVICWGDDELGRLANDAAVPSGGINQISGLSGATAVGVGLGEVCALLSGGSVACWGSRAGSNGEIGACAATPSLSPVPLRAVADVRQFVLNEVQACALLADGGTACWGEDVNPGAACSPAPVQELPATTTLALGGSSSIAIGFTAGTFACALLVDGSIRCWGNNADGELGNGTFTSSNTPVAVIR